MSVRASIRAEYERWHAAISGREGADHDASPWHEMAKSHLGALAGLRVLEIGCGRGGFSRYLIDQGARLTAADFSRSALDAAGALLEGSGATLVQADVQQLPFPDGRFDLVVSLETLEHVASPPVALRELVRVTQVGGRLCVSTPNYMSVLGLYRVYRELTGRPFTEEGQPLNQPLMLVDRLRRLRRLGCRIDVVDGVGHYAYLPRRHPIRLRWLDRPRALTKWFAAHSLTLSTRLGG